MTRRSLPIEFTRRSFRQVEEAARWWRENRPAAPQAVSEELARALEIVALQPAIGAKTSSRRLRRVRRVLLPRIQYHLYYQVDARTRRLVVIAFWHAQRGTFPQL